MRKVFHRNQHRSKCRLHLKFLYNLGALKNFEAEQDYFMILSWGRYEKPLRSFANCLDFYFNSTSKQGFVELK